MDNDVKYLLILRQWIFSVQDKLFGYTFSRYQRYVRRYCGSMFTLKQIYLLEIRLRESILEINKYRYNNITFLFYVYINIRCAMYICLIILLCICALMSCAQSCFRNFVFRMRNNMQTTENIGKKAVAKCCAQTLLGIFSHIPLRELFSKSKKLSLCNYRNI